MHIDLEEIDSRVLGQAVLTLRDFDPGSDFASFERDYMARYHPRYVTSKVPVGQVHAVQALENRGFRFVEVQVGGVVPIRKRQDVKAYPYRFERVTTEKVLDEVLAIAGTSFDIDRFVTDPDLDSGFSGRRYREYVRKSYQSADEAVYRLFDPADGKTLSFKTHRILNDREVDGLLGAVRVDLKGSGLGLLMDHYYYNQLLDDGKMQMRTRISVANTVMFRYFVGTGSMRVESISAVLRKLYPS